MGADQGVEEGNERTYAALADLPVEVEGWSMATHERDTSSDFTRKTTVFEFEGAGQTGQGEDVTYPPEAHDALLDAPPELPLDGEYSLSTATDVLDRVDLFPAEPPDRETFRNYRRWGVESALLDLALRQGQTDLGSVLEREPAPVRFVVSTSLGDPPSAARIGAWLAIDSELEFKLDATVAWDDDLRQSLAETGQIRTIDLKAHYGEGDDDWQGRTDPEPSVYRELLEAFPQVVFEDPAVTDATRPVLEPEANRLSWDAPVHSVPEFEALPLAVGWCNVKPSRFGTLQRLFDFLDYARDAGIRLYGGGQFELAVGRGQLHDLASLFYPDGPNDIAPRPYNDPEPRSGLPASPLAPPATGSGFGWPAHGETE